MGVQFKVQQNGTVAVTTAVSSNSGGAVKATYIWQNVTDPNNPITKKNDNIAAPSSSVDVQANDLTAAPMNLYCMLLSLIATDDATIWSWAIQNGAPVPAVDDFGNPVSGQGPHKAVQVGGATKGHTAHIPISIKA